MNLKVGNKVRVDIIINGYWQHSFKTEIIGFTKSGRVKVKPCYLYENKKHFSIDNISKIN